MIDFSLESGACQTIHPMLQSASMNKLRILILVLLFNLAFTSDLWASVEPSLEWKVLSSAHFDLIYDAQQQELAELYLVRLESARTKLSSVWQKLPERLPVVLNDRTDLTNGYAAPIPYLHSMLFPSLPGPMESISELGDWAENIAIHELTHILTFEQKRGAVAFLANIFGSIITPNMLLPRWWLEGVAVDAETRFSNQGRLRSNFQDATLRALASSSRWQEFQYPEINQFDIPSWPYGARPYLFGSLMWSEMIALEGAKMIHELNDAMGGRAPYFLSAPIKNKLKGENLPGLFELTKQSTLERVEKQKLILEQQPLTSAKKFIDPDFIESFSPRISPDGKKMAFLAKDDSLKRTIQILVRPELSQSFSPSHRLKQFGPGQEVSTQTPDIQIPRITDDAPPGGTISRISWLPDSQSFVFDLVSEVNWFHDHSDLWIYSLKDSKAKQLTHNLRGREPDVSSDGSYVAYVGLEAARTHLAIYDLKAKTAKIIFRPQALHRVSWPTWIDKNNILFSIRNSNSEILMSFNLQTGLAKEINLGLSEASLPFVGTRAIYFVSNQNGVRNLYRADSQFKKATPITHLWTGAYSGDWDPHRSELWLTQIGENGFELVNLAEKDFSLKADALPKIDPLFADRYPAQSQTELAPLNSTQAEYSALSYLMPRYWLPFFFFDDKGLQASVSTSGFDPLGKHSYTIFGSYDSATKLGSYQLTYLNHTQKPKLLFAATKLSSYLADPNDITWNEQNSADAIFQLSNLSTELELILGAESFSHEVFGVKASSYGARVGLKYSNFSQTGNQISPESGGEVRAFDRHYFSSKEDDEFNQANLSATKFGKIPWFKHHAWMARVSGQYINHKVSIANYASTVSSLAALPPGTDAMQMRGYVSGAFLGQSMAQGTLEYRFPIRRIDWGGNYFPFYAKRISGAFVGDLIGLDGYQYDAESEPAKYRRVTNWKGFGSVGFESKFDFNLGYHLDMQMILGVYVPVGSEYTKSEPRLGLALGL